MNRKLYNRVLSTANGSRSCRCVNVMGHLTNYTLKQNTLTWMQMIFLESCLFLVFFLYLIFLTFYILHLLKKHFRVIIEGYKISTQCQNPSLNINDFNWVVIIHRALIQLLLTWRKKSNVQSEEWRGKCVKMYTTQPIRSSSVHCQIWQYLELSSERKKRYISSC